MTKYNNRYSFQLIIESVFRIINQDYPDNVNRLKILAGISNEYNLTQKEMNKKTKSGKRIIIEENIKWCLDYLKHLKVIDKLNNNKQEYLLNYDLGSKFIDAIDFFRNEGLEEPIVSRKFLFWFDQRYGSGDYSKRHAQIYKLENFSYLYDYYVQQAGNNLNSANLFKEGFDMYILISNSKIIFNKTFLDYIEKSLIYFYNSGSSDEKNIIHTYLNSNKYEIRNNKLSRDTNITATKHNQITIDDIEDLT